MSSFLTALPQTLQGLTDPGQPLATLLLPLQLVTSGNVLSILSEASASFKEFSVSPSFRKHLERVIRQCLSPALSFSAWNHRHGHITSAGSTPQILKCRYLMPPAQFPHGS